MAVFAVQSRGTERIGKVFGTTVLIWFMFIAVTGGISMAHNLEVLRALNPVYGVRRSGATANTTRRCRLRPCCPRACR